jgi:hypothetical protein
MGVSTGEHLNRTHDRPTSGCLRFFSWSESSPFPEGGPGLGSTHSHVKSRTHPPTLCTTPFTPRKVPSKAELSEPEFTQAAEQHFVLFEVRMADSTSVHPKPTKHEPAPSKGRGKMNTVKCVESVSAGHTKSTVREREGAEETLRTAQHGELSWEPRSNSSRPQQRT